MDLSFARISILRNNNHAIEISFSFINLHERQNFIKIISHFDRSILLEAMRESISYEMQSTSPMRWSNTANIKIIYFI